jgi:putative oxidoreductase
MMKKLLELVEKVFGWLSSNVWIPLLVARVAMASEFVISGWGKLQDLPKLAAYFDSLHIPAPAVNAAAAATTEFLGGTLLLIGLGTRFAGVALTVVMLVAIFTAKLHEAPLHTPADFFYLPEPCYIVIFLVLIFFGGGKVSLDELVARRRKGARS